MSEVIQHKKSISIRFLEKYLSVIKPLNTFLFLLFVFSLPFPQHYARVFIVVWGISWLLEGRFLRISSLKWRKSLFPSLVLLLMFLWALISVSWVNIEIRPVAIQYLPWIFVGIFIVSVCGLNEYYRSIDAKRALWIGCLGAFCTYLVAYNMAGDAFHITPPQDFFYFGLFKHHLWLSIPYIIAICFSKDIYTFYTRQYPKIYVLIGVVLCNLIFLYTIYISGSRISLLTLLLLTVVAFWVEYKGKYKWISLFGLVLVCGVVLYGLIRFNTRIQELYNQTQGVVQQGVDVSQPFTYEPRFALNHIFWGNISEYGWKGLGWTGDELFYKNYLLERGLNYPKLFHPHNVFYVNWICLGPLGALLLLFFFIYTPFCFKDRTRILAIYLCVMWAFIGCTDSIFSKMGSLYIVAFSMILLSLSDREFDHTYSER